MMRTWIWRPVAFGLGVALLIIAVRTISSFLPSRVSASDFSQAYVAALAWTRGLDPYAVKLDEFAQKENLTYTEIVPQATNPPLLLWMLRPLTLLTPDRAFAVWVGLEVLSLVVVFVGAHRLLGRQLPPAGWCLAAGLACCSMPMFAHFWFSQVQLLLLALVMTGTPALRAGRPRTACVVLTLAAVLKLFPSPLVVMPALAAKGRRRWELLGWAAVLLLAWAALPGWSPWGSFRRDGLPFLTEMASGRYFNFSLASFLPWPATVLVGAVLIGAAWWKSTQRFDDASVCLLLVATVMCSMIAWVHYLVWMFYPLCVIGAQMRRATGRRRVWLTTLLLASILVFNVAGSNPFEFTNRFGRSLNASAPLLMMLLLYGHFFFAREQSA
jgi:hypothetical protein